MGITKKRKAVAGKVDDKKVYSLAQTIHENKVKSNINTDDVENLFQLSGFNYILDRQIILKKNLYA